MSTRLSTILLTAALLATAAIADDRPPVELNPSERLPAPDILPASDEGLKAMRMFQLPPGFKAALWAAEPMLANPVAIQFDERGRLFVSETYRYGTSVLDIRGYMHMLEDDLASRTIEDRLGLILRQFGEKGLKNLAIEGEVLRLLEDTDGDGTADRSSIYADGFNSALDGIASGALIRNGKVWFTNIPSLWQFTGEHKAETRTELSRGYGVHFGYTGHDLHGLAWGPDGKLYFSIGDRSAHATAIDGSVADATDTGAVFRCNPDGSKLEVVHHGLRNPQDLLFTENGDLFTGDNDSDQGDQERLVQIVEDGDSGWRIGYQFSPLGDAGPWNFEKMWWPRHADQPAFMLPPICNIEDGPSGIAYYPGTGLAPGYEGTIFITHFKGAITSSGIQTYKLRPNGATYAATDSKPFLSGALPTDVKFGPDGRIYYSDWVEAWPKSKRGRIYALYHPDHLDDSETRETKKLINEGMQKRGSAALARLLGHADRRVRLEAQFTLAERGASSLETFAAVAAQTDAPPLARLHGIWGLGQLAGQNVAGALAPARTLLKDADAEVRAQAARTLGDHRAADVVSSLATMLEDASPRARFFAAQSLGKLGAKEAVPAVLDALRANDDRDAYLRHALVMALVGARDTAALNQAATSDSRAIRLGVLLAFRRLGEPSIARFLTDADPFLVAEAARAINDEPIPAAMPALAKLASTPGGKTSVDLRSLNARFRDGTPDAATALAQIAARADVPPDLRAEALVHLASWPKPPARDRLVGIFRPITGSAHDPADARSALTNVFPTLLGNETPAAVQKAAFAAARDLDLRTSADALFATMIDDSKSATIRAAALGALDFFRDSRIAQAIEAATKTQIPELARAALPVAARLSPAQFAPVIASITAHGGAADQRAAFRALGSLDHPDATKITLGLLDQLDAGGIATAAQVELLDAAEIQAAPAVQARLAARTKKFATSADPVAAYAFALEGGDSWDGRSVFNSHPVMACLRCHVVDGVGGEAGPDLSTIGAARTTRELLDAVIKPNASIAPGFETVGVTLKSGELHAGTVVSQDKKTLTLRLPDGTTRSFSAAEIEKRERAPSAMPEIYGTVLSRTDLRDLIAYLAGLRFQLRETAPIPRALRKTPVFTGDGGHGE